MKQFLSIFLICLLCGCGNAYAQVPTAFNINRHNGLPSDHVYSMITDRHGYLWMCTDKGVVKYNGYECRTFTTSDGLPTDDVWNLLEDLRGRIWLGCISGEMGYIYNDKYYKANLKNINGTIFPSALRRCDSGIIFGSQHLNGNPLHTLCIGTRDTIYGISFKDKRINLPDSLIAPGNIGINEANEVSHMYNHYIHFKIKNINRILDSPSKVQWYIHTISGDNNAWKYYKNFVCMSIGKYTIHYNIDWAITKIILRHVAKSSYDSIDIKKYGITQPIKQIGYDNTIGKENVFFTYTQDYILAFKVADSVQLTNIYTVPYTGKVNGGKIMPTTYIRNGLWDAGISTSTNGVYLSDKSRKFITYPINLDGYNHIGKIHDTITLWWSGSLRKLLFVSHGRIIKEKALDISSFINVGVLLNPDTLILAGSYSYYVNLKTGAASEIMHYSNIRGFALSNANYFYGIDRSKFFSVYKRFGDVRFAPTNRTIDIDRFKNLVYDETSNLCWAYADNKVVVYDGHEKRIFDKSQLLGDAADKIENISIDKIHGSVFIKTVSELYYLNPATMKSIPLHFNINLKGTRINVHNNVLIICGNFGVAFCRILSKGNLTPPIVYYNTKKIYYNEVLSHAVSDGNIILLTDLATYQVAIPDSLSFSSKNVQNNGIQYNLIVYCNNYIRKFSAGNVDTVDQVTRNLTLNVINPIGNGKVMYYYRLSETGTWQKSPTGEIPIPQYLKADNHYPVSVFFMDDAWKSNVVNLSIYIKPYWWQTKNMRIAIGAGILLLVALIIVSVVLITRRLVLRANEKKNMQMELELKAIYAQINPHFIFNTLTSALLLISRNQMNEAYTHVSKFSKLLRSYLKSSRNKYISIGDEIDNLRTYTELQQTRFKDRFRCDIIVDPDLNASSIKIPSLLIQPFVENAVNHGLVHSNKQGHLVIEFRYIKSENKAICIISDNGIGRARSRENKKDTENTLGSYGNLMIKDLVDIFNRYEEIKISIEYIDKELPETGTSVVITITNPVLE